MKRIESVAHALYIAKAHAEGRFASARRRRNGGQGVSCPCDLCIAARLIGAKPVRKATR